MARLGIEPRTSDESDALPTALRDPALKCIIDGWMNGDFKSFSTVFQSYQDDGQMIMKGSVQWNPVYG